MCKDVLFLGAGFSAAVAGIPTMADLTKKVKTKILNDFKESIVDHYKNEIPDQLKDDVEAMLSYLSADLPWKSKVQQYENLALYEKIVEKIVDVISSETSKNNVCYKSGYVYDFFSKFMENKENSIISLNYDVLCENFIQEIDGYDTDFSRLYGAPITYVGSRIHGGGFLRYPSSEISLIKLHGSINWKWCGLSDNDQIYFSGKELLGNVWDEGQSSAGLRTCIVPPVMDKSLFYGNVTLRTLWEIAAQKISSADRIFIIGFSFPQTDYPVRFLFQSALRQCNAKIYVINNASGKTLNELKTNYDIVFGDKYNFINGVENKNQENDPFKTFCYNYPKDF